MLFSAIAHSTARFFGLSKQRGRAPFLLSKSWHRAISNLFRISLPCIALFIRSEAEPAYISYLNRFSHVMSELLLVSLASGPFPSLHSFLQTVLYFMKGNQLKSQHAKFLSFLTMEMLKNVSSTFRLLTDPPIASGFAVQPALQSISSRESQRYHSLPLFP